MSHALSYDVYQIPNVSNPDVPNESMKGTATVGWIMVAVFFGLFGTWAAVAAAQRRRRCERRGQGGR
jgi:hypothetical protein